MWVAHAPGMPGTFSAPLTTEETARQRSRHASRHVRDARAVIHVGIDNPRWRGKRSRHSRRMHNAPIYVSGKRPMQNRNYRPSHNITRLRIGHTKATKSHILSRGPPTGCHHCGQTLTIDHMLLECALLQECRDEYYTVDSLNALFEKIPETCIVEFLREAGFFYLIWCNVLTSTSPQTCTIWSDLSNYLENESNSETHFLV